MNSNLPFFVILYLMAGFSLIPLAKKSPKYFGPAKEIMEFLVVFTASGGGLGALAAFFFAFLWPFVLILGLFMPALTLEDKLENRTENEQNTKTKLIGTVACCLSDLKPSGLIEADGKTMDATCLEHFLPKGTQVKIVKKQGFNFVVEKIV
jgi:membrane-bound ClpP family serine protease